MAFVYIPFHMIQWGHRFSAVDTINIATIVWRNYSGFQWGHDFSAVDTCTPGITMVAGMDVSMEPRLFSRGYLMFAAYVGAISAFQWGHGFSAVDTR